MKVEKFEITLRFALWHLLGKLSYEIVYCGKLIIS